MRVVCISDTHLRHDFPVPTGDILIHAGDLTLKGDEQELEKACHWLDSLDFRYTVVIAGNHDWLFQREPEEAQRIAAFYGLFYLQDEEVNINGLKIYGTPWQPNFCNWAFNVDTEGELADHYSNIPLDTDILITHCPPRGTLDQAIRSHHTMFTEPGDVMYENVGSTSLHDVWRMIFPRLHVFGHIHEAHGVKQYEFSDETRYQVNASICDERYRPVHKPVVIDL